MLISFALIFLCGMLLGDLFKRMGLPSLLGMLMTGIVLGPSMLDVLDSTVLSISADLRQLALIVILARAGLSLDIDDLKKAGRPAVLMCFVPACFEILGMALLAPRLLHLSLLEAVVMGAVIAAVSPAVVVPKMLYLMEQGYGTDKHIPQIIMAGASVDDVFVIVLFTAATGLAQGRAVSPLSLLRIPASILTGIMTGIILGVLCGLFFRRVHIRDSSKVVILLSLAFLLVAAEQLNPVPFSGLLAVMTVGVTIQKQNAVLADRLSDKYAKLWVAAEVILFVLVGAAVDLRYALGAGLPVVAVILGALAFRMLGVLVCTFRTNLSAKEKLFCMIAYIPKATVQAAIGALPLAMGLPRGQVVLTTAVLSILITAPLGALGTDLTYKKLLRRQSSPID